MDPSKIDNLYYLIHCIAKRNESIKTYHKLSKTATSKSDTV